MPPLSCHALGTCSPVLSKPLLPPSLLPSTPDTPPSPHTRIHPNLRSTVYCNAIAQGGEREWDFAWEQFQKETLVNEADKLRTALACSNEVWILNR